MGSRPSSELWIRQADAPDLFKSIPVTTSTVAPLSASWLKKTDSTSQDDSTNTNNFVILDRAANRVQRFELSTNATDDSEFVSVNISSVAVLELELSTENREFLSR